MGDYIGRRERLLLLIIMMIMMSTMIIWGGGGGMIGDWVYFLFILLIGLWPEDMPATPHSTESGERSNAQHRKSDQRVKRCCLLAACALSSDWVSAPVESLGHIVIAQRLYLVYRDSLSERASIMIGRWKGVVFRWSLSVLNCHPVDDIKNVVCEGSPLPCALHWPNRR